MAESLTPAALHKPALIHNPRSHQNLQRALTIPPELLAATPADHEQLRATLADFAQQGVDLLIVSGGDGTLREILGLLPSTFGERVPAFALIAAGNSNSVAIDVGATAPGPRALQAILDAVRSGRWSREVRRPPLAVCWPDGSRDTVYGFFMGAAALTRATQYEHENVHAGGRLSVVFTLMATFAQCLRGDSDWLHGNWMSLGVDGDAPVEGKRFLFVATSLHRIMLRLWPFWDDAAGPFRYVEIDAHPPRLGSALLPLLFGKPTQWMRRSGAYRSRNASRLSLRLDSPLIIDGEAFAPDSNGRVEVDTAAPIRFLSP